MLMAAPSLAAKGGNAANAALCQAGGYPGVLLAQDGTAFKNEGKCTSYGAKGGQIAGVNETAGAAEGGLFPISASGFGLKPGSAFFIGGRYQPSGISFGGSLEVAGDGTFFFSGGLLPCEVVPYGKVGTVDLEAETADGHVFIREFPGPTGC
jgi:hypothetical protein